MDKKTIRYTTLINELAVGGHAVLQLAEDHPNCSSRLVNTSQIVRIGDNGEFETLNTHYKPVGN